MRVISIDQTHRARQGAARIAALTLAGLLAGCSADRVLSAAPSGSGASASAPAPSSGSASTFGSLTDTILPRRVETPAPDPAAEAAKFALENCPPVNVRQGAATLILPPNNTDAFSLRYQGTIGELARECRLEGGIMRIRVGMQGRVLVGPAGGSGQVDVPLRYAVVKEGIEPKTVVSKFHRLAVAVPDGQPNVAFTHVDNDVAFPLPADRDLDAYVVYVGFDPVGEKPQPAKRQANRPGAAPRR